MKRYNGCWMDLFKVSIYTNNDRPGAKGKILLETPDIDYLFDKEQWKEFKKKVNEV